MNLQEIDLNKIYRIWKSNLGPFQCFFRSTPFVSLQTYDDFTLSEEDINEYDQNILNKIIENIDEKSFVIVDLPLNEILTLALILNNEYCIKPILNINLLFHPFGIIGGLDEINKLINNGLKLKEINTENFVMLIPYDRYDNNLEPNNLCDKLNNQYAISEDDLPYVATLKELGYSKITILTKDNLKEDLNEYLDSIDRGGIVVELIRVR